MTILGLLAIWLLASFPLGCLVGRFLGRRFSR
jgi:hypothetical protein